MHALREALRIPFGLPAPAFIVKLAGKLIGPDSDLILKGVRAMPVAASQMGYKFRFPELPAALTDALSSG